MDTVFLGTPDAGRRSLHETKSMIDSPRALCCGDLVLCVLETGFKTANRQRSHL